MSTLAMIAILAAAGSPTPGNERPSGTEVIQEVLDTELREVERVADMEPAVLGVTVREFMARQGSLRISPDLADPWEDWNAGCVPDARLPARQMMLAAGSPGLWVIVYREGGIRVQTILEVIGKEEGGWVLRYRASQRVPHNAGIEELKLLLRAGVPGGGTFVPIRLEDPYRRTYCVELTNAEGRTVAKRLLADTANGKESHPTPAFLRPPAHPEPFHGFPLVEETCHQGYCYGAITDYLQPDTEEGCTVGDGFVEAPDGTRAGLHWMVQEKTGYAVLEQPDGTRWGVYLFAIPKPVASLDDLKRTFRQMVPALRNLHDEATGRGGLPDP